MSKNLTFKLVMDADTKAFVSNMHQSEKAAKDAFAALKNGSASIVGDTSSATKEVDQLGTQSQETAQQVKQLDKELEATSQELQQTEQSSKGVSGELQGLKTGFNALTGALAALGIGTTAMEIAQTADEYKNLSGRISIAIGDHGNLQKAMDDVKNVAINTNSNLTATGDLYSRLTKIGQEMKWPQEQALALTETINKAIQVGGGSAASNEAAITQLNQALGSGVLRGDEFNSIMEQSPRLAQALADGLDVTTGKLREMAGEGKLTTDVITNALLSQSEAISAEFAKFPTTIGASIENLKTAWTVYIGEADAATGASAKVAEAIKFVAENLDTMVSTLTLAGQAFIAYKALNIGMMFLDKAAGIRAASTAIAQETTAVVANTQAQIANAAATRTAATAKTQLAAGSTAAATSAAATGGSIMTLVSQLGALGVAVTAFGVLVPTVFQPIGTAIGEGAAKLMGYGKAIEELEKQMALDEARTKVAAEVKASFAAASEKAREKTFQLTEESKKLIASFDELVKKGEETSEALKKISESMKFDSTTGINDSITALIALEKQGKVTADQISASIKQAMSTEDLVVFTTNAQVAFAGTAFEAQKMALVAEQAMVLAVERTGFSFEQLQGKGSAASRSLINDVQIIIGSLEELKQQGLDTAFALNQSISRAVNGAETIQQLNAIRGQISSIKSELGETVANGLLQQVEVQAFKINRQLDEMTAGVNSVNEAFSIFGLRSRDEAKLIAAEYKAAYEVLLNSGQATTDQLQQAFRRYADVAIQANNGVVDGFTKAQASALDLEVRVDDTGKTAVKANDAVKESLHRVRNATGNAGDGFDELGRRGVASGNATRDAWEEARQAAMAAAKADENSVTNRGMAGRKSRTEYTLEGVKQALRSQGFSDEKEINRKANELFNASASTRKNALMQYQYEAGKNIPGFALDFKAVNLMAANNKDYIDLMLQKMSPSVGKTGSNSLNDYAPSIPSTPSVRDTNQPAKEVTYNFDFNGKQMKFSGPAGQESLMNELVNQLKIQAKST